MVQNNVKAFQVIKEELDEKKIVTFKWLSRLLNVHNTVAKRLLTDFIHVHEKDKYKITYLLYGKKKTNGELIISLINHKDNSPEEDEVDIIDKTIYSICQEEESFDNTRIYEIDKTTFDLQCMNLLSINYNKPIIPVDKATLASTKSKEENSFENNQKCEPIKQKNEKIEREEQNESTKRADVKRKSAKQSKMNSAMGGALSKFLSKNISEKNSVKVQPHGPVENTSNGEIKVEKPNMDLVEPEIKKSTTKSTTKEIKVEKPTIDLVEPEIKKSTTKSTTKKSRVAEKSSKKKKMKRIILPDNSDSESGSSDNIDDVTESEELLFEEETIPNRSFDEVESPCIKIIDGKKRKRKIVEKTGTDKDGYFFTVKEVVYESCDENDDESKNEASFPKRPKIESTLSKKTTEKKVKISEAPIKKKQSSILSFFQKTSQ